MHYSVLQLRKLLRVSKPVTYLLGTEFPSNLDLIEIDITFKCNLKCYNCDRSCRQAPSNDSMTVEQIANFIDESRSANKFWERIRILGGEPTLHPEFFEIINLLRKYRDDFSPSTTIEVVSNGYGKKVQQVLDQIPDDVSINNTGKDGKFQEKFEPFNLAPKDKKQHMFTDYTNGCWITSYCGIGLNKYGYYHCAVAGAIDRVGGFDLGLKSLPTREQLDQMKETFCQFCGHFEFRDFRPIEDRTPVEGEPKSRSWIQLYDSDTIPLLTPY